MRRLCAELEPGGKQQIYCEVNWTGCPGNDAGRFVPGRWCGTDIMPSEVYSGP